MITCELMHTTHPFGPVFLKSPVCIPNDDDGDDVELLLLFRRGRKVFDVIPLANDDGDDDADVNEDDDDELVDDVLLGLVARLPVDSCVSNSGLF